MSPKKLRTSRRRWPSMFQTIRRPATCRRRTPCRRPRLRQIPLRPDMELANLRQRLQNLQSDNTILKAKLKEALAAQPAMVDAGELAKAQEQIQSLLKENALLKMGGTSNRPQTIVVADTN